MKKNIAILAIATLTSIATLSAETNVESRAASLIERANKMLKNNDFAPALNTLNTILETTPKNIRALRLRGNAFFAMENYSEAMKDFNTVILLQPKNARAYFDRGIVHFALGNDDLASDDIEKAYVLNPEIEKQLGSKSGLGAKIRSLRERSETSKHQVRHKGGLIDFKYGGLTTKEGKK